MKVSLVINMEIEDDVPFSDIEHTLDYAVSHLTGEGLLSGDHFELESYDHTIVTETDREDAKEHIAGVMDSYIQDNLEPGDAVTDCDCVTMATKIVDYHLPGISVPAHS